jgi:hypothetical protein
MSREQLANVTSRVRQLLEGVYLFHLEFVRRPGPRLIGPLSNWIRDHCAVLPEFERFRNELAAASEANFQTECFPEHWFASAHHAAVAVVDQVMDDLNDQAEVYGEPDPPFQEDDDPRTWAECFRRATPEDWRRSSRDYQVEALPLTENGIRQLLASLEREGARAVLAFKDDAPARPPASNGPASPDQPAAPAADGNAEAGRAAEPAPQPAPRSGPDDFPYWWFDGRQVDVQGGAENEHQWLFIKAVWGNGPAPRPSQSLDELGVAYGYPLGVEGYKTRRREANKNLLALRVRWEVRGTSHIRFARTQPPPPPGS